MARVNKKVLPVTPCKSSLSAVLGSTVHGFSRLDVRLTEIRVTSSKRGRLRFAILIDRSKNNKLHQCYLAAAKLMFMRYKIGDSPLVDYFTEPADLCTNYIAVFNHTREVIPSVVLRNMEFIHIQAERIYAKYGPREGYWNHYSIDESRPL